MTALGKLQCDIPSFYERPQWAEYALSHLRDAHAYRHTGLCAAQCEPLRTQATDVASAPDTKRPPGGGLSI